jgi:predicted site-specific integrase-resolvase
VYARVSSHDQKTKGDLDRQKARLLEYCALMKYDIEYVYDEVGSGYIVRKLFLNAISVKSKRLIFLYVAEKDEII